MKASLILASGSASRQQMLREAGYIFDIIPADIDEETIIQNLLDKNIPVENISMILAQEKASYISKIHQEQYIIGSDQILLMNNNVYSKAKNKEEAKNRLKEFQGKTHVLNSAVSVFKNGEEIFSCADEASLTMKQMGDEAIENYCAKAGESLTACVGCYALESVGIRLFKEIKGDYFTILGMPLLPLINFLDQEGFTL